MSAPRPQTGRIRGRPDRDLATAIRGAQRAIIAAAPHYAYLLHHVPVVTVDDAEAVAWTDGKRICVTQRFAKLEGPGYHRTDRHGRHPAYGPREFVLIHELLHVARCHPGRMVRMRERLAPFSPDLANIVMDAQINEDIAQWQPSPGPIPDGFVTEALVQAAARRLAERAGRPVPPILAAPVHHASVEELHDALLQLAHEADPHERQTRASPPQPDDDPPPDAGSAAGGDTEDAGDTGEGTDSRGPEGSGADAADGPDPASNPAGSGSVGETSAAGSSDEPADDAADGTGSDETASGPAPGTPADEAGKARRAGSPEGRDPPGDSASPRESSATPPDAPPRNRNRAAPAGDPATPPGTPGPAGSPDEPVPAPDGPGDAGRSPAADPATAGRQLADRIIDALRAGLQEPRGDVRMPPPGERSIDQAAEDEAEWRELLDQAGKLPGSEPGNGITGFIDAPPDDIPWQRVLHPLLSRYLAPRPGPSMSVPSRQTIAADAAGLDPFIEPGHAGWSEGGALGLCVDSSASIDDDALAQLGGIVFAIALAFNSPVHVAVGDTLLQQRADDLDANPQELVKLRQEGLKGRGGTRFEPLIACALEQRADLIMYLTDGYATFPDPPPVPVVWAVPDRIGRPSSEFPWGHVIRID